MHLDNGIDWKKYNKIDFTAYFDEENSSDIDT